MKYPRPDQFAAFVGIGWADAKHDLCLQPASSEKREFSTLLHRPEIIDEWARALRQRFHGQPIAVCLELTPGPLVSALQKYPLLVLFPANPATLAKSRQASTPSHAKDDPPDAALQLERLLHRRDKLQPLTPQSPPTRASQQLVEARRRLVGDKVRLTNRLTSVLKSYFPQALQWVKGKDTLVLCDFPTRWPTLKQAQHARKTTLVAFFRGHHTRSPA